MKVSILIEDKGLEVKLPLPKSWIADLYDVLLFIPSDDEETWETFKLNGWDKTYSKIISLLDHLIHDVIHGGKFYIMKNDKLVLSEHRRWMVKKPIWEVKDK